MNEEIASLKCPNCGVPMTPKGGTLDYDTINETNCPMDSKMPIKIIVTKYIRFKCEICKANFELVCGQAEYKP